MYITNVPLQDPSGRQGAKRCAQRIRMAQLGMIKLLPGLKIPACMNSLMHRSVSYLAASCVASCRLVGMAKQVRK